MSLLEKLKRYFHIQENNHNLYISFSELLLLDCQQDLILNSP